MYVLYEIAKRLGIEKALGKTQEGKLALRKESTSVSRFWHESWSRGRVFLCFGWNKSSVLSTGWSLRKGKTSSLFLYDVTSSYLEGTNNALARYGYNRDKKEGKKQIVVGLLCDAQGIPVSVEVFEGNTSDSQTVHAQIRKICDRWGCEGVTLVGDRGMLKSSNQKELKENGLTYITAITKAQIRTLIGNGTIQMNMFDIYVKEVECEGVRYILRKNPVRAQEIARGLSEKARKMEQKVESWNLYLHDHPRAKVETALKHVGAALERYKIGSWLNVQATERTLVLTRDEQAYQQHTELDGCYALKTDLPQEKADKEVIHARYRDLEGVGGRRALPSVHFETARAYWICVLST